MVNLQNFVPANSLKTLWKKLTAAPYHRLFLTALLNGLSHTILGDFSKKGIKKAGCQIQPA
jgi:hypothetical protein